MQAQVQMENTEEMETETNEKLLYTDYTEKSFVISGEATREYKDSLKTLGGKFNRNLRNGLAGWIFPKSKQESVMSFVLKVNSGEMSSADLPTFDSLDIPVVDTPKAVNYQFVKFKVFKPKEGMKVKLTTFGKSSMQGKVTSVESYNKDGVIDTVYVDFDGKTSMGAVCRGKWQIYGYFEPHTLYFME